MPRPAVLAAVLIVVGIVGGAALALAQSPRSPSSTARPTTSADLGSLIAPATGTPEPRVTGSAPDASTSAGPTSMVVIDPSLLRVLPATVKDLPLVEDPDSESHDLTDPALGREASALAAALVVDPASDDFAYASVIHLRPGIYSDDYFRSWRDTYDVGACSQAGGVAQSSAEATLAGHRTFIGHCVGGILTYHVYLAPSDLIVSISSLGTQHLGQLVVEGLR
jgi:hypothetical protein